MPRRRRPQTWAVSGADVESRIKENLTTVKEGWCLLEVERVFQGTDGW